MDLFAFDTHNQLSRYYALEKDPKAARRDAFEVNWLLEYQPYINPPWVDISRCLDKIQQDQAQVMMVVHKWENIFWWKQITDFCIRHTDLTEAIYLQPDGTPWKKPIWDTRVGILDGSRTSGQSRT